MSETLCVVCMLVFVHDAPPRQFLEVQPGWIVVVLAQCEYVLAYLGFDRPILASPIDRMSCRCFVYSISRSYSRTLCNGYSAHAVSYACDHSVLVIAYCSMSQLSVEGFVLRDFAC